MAIAEGRIDRDHSVRGTRNGARVSRDDRSAVFSLLPAWCWRKIDVEGEYFPERIKYLAHVCGLASERSKNDETLFSFGREFVVHGTWKICRGKDVSRICFRSGQSRALPTATDFTDLPGRRLADMGSSGPAIRGPSSRRAQLCERAAGARPGDYGSGIRGAICVDHRNRLRFRGEADRRVSAGRGEAGLETGGRAKAWAIRAIAEWVRTAGGDGSPARALLEKFRAADRTGSE